MSELKVHRIDNIISAYKIGKAFCMKTEEEVYIKSEADKVIAEKDKEIAEKDKEISRLNDKALQYKVLDKEHCRDLNTQERRFALQMAHHKYKRCLAMAWWCSAELGMLVSTWESKIKYYKRWQKRWLEIAEQFKGANNA